jgi:hypothetical protein
MRHLTTTLSLAIGLTLRFVLAVKAAAVRSLGVALLSLVALAVGAMGVTTPALAGDAATGATGTLALKAVVSLQSRSAQLCPAGTGPTITCAARQGSGAVPGLGKAAVTYMYVLDQLSPGCPAPSTFRALSTDIRFVIAGKGAITLRTASSGCLNPMLDEYLAPANQEFTITAGTGIYAGASGSGTVSRSLTHTDFGSRGQETWKGTLVVAGLEFELIPPTLAGAVAKTVRAPKGAKSMRVTYKVTAQDGVDGPLPTSCAPRSGSRFKIGRTKVRCSATDTSGNTASTAFTVTVKPGR